MTTGPGEGPSPLSLPFGRPHDYFVDRDMTQIVTRRGPVTMFAMASAISPASKRSIPAQCRPIASRSSLLSCADGSVETAAGPTSATRTCRFVSAWRSGSQNALTARIRPARSRRYKRRSRSSRTPSGTELTFMRSAKRHGALSARRRGALSARRHGALAAAASKCGSPAWR